METDNITQNLLTMNKSFTYLLINQIAIKNISVFLNKNLKNCIKCDKVIFSWKALLNGLSRITFFNRKPFRSLLQDNRISDIKLQSKYRLPLVKTLPIYSFHYYDVVHHTSFLCTEVRWPKSLLL